MSPWKPLQQLISWYPIFKSSHCNSFDDRAPMDFFTGSLILKWAAEFTTWQGTRRVVPAIVTRVTCPIDHSNAECYLSPLAYGVLNSGLGVVKVLHEAEECQLIEEDLGQLHQQVLTTVTHPEKQTKETSNIGSISYLTHWPLEDFNEIFHELFSK